MADYLRMLRLHLTGQPYNKAAHNRALTRQLRRRTLPESDFAAEAL